MSELDHEAESKTPSQTARTASRFRGEEVDFRIRTYEVFIGGTVRVPGTVGTYGAWIQCRGKRGEILDIYFQDPGTPRLENAVDGAARKGTLFLPTSRLPWVVDILRNESPVFAYLNHSRPGLNRIHTGREPVGEGEMHS